MWWRKSVFYSYFTYFSVFNNAAHINLSCVLMQLYKPYIYISAASSLLWIIKIETNVKSRLLVYIVALFLNWCEIFTLLNVYYSSSTFLSRWHRIITACKHNSDWQRCIFLPLYQRKPSVSAMKCTRWMQSSHSSSHETSLLCKQDTSKSWYLIQTGTDLPLPHRHFQ